MNHNTVEILKNQKQFLNFILTVAEGMLPSERFRLFKKLVFDQFHRNVKPELFLILNGDQVMAVPPDDNFDGKECCHDR